jgi:hypothetical protein
MRYGNDRIFCDFDVMDLAPGVDYVQSLHLTVNWCKSMLVVIGPQWASAIDANGRRRLDDPSDFIRTEVAAALLSGKPVVPVLVDGAAMPRTDDLPIELRPLAFQNAIVLTDYEWNTDIHKLYEALDPLLRPSFLGRLAAALGILIGRAGEKPKVTPSVKSPLSNSYETAGATAAQALRSNQQTESGASIELNQVFVNYAEEDRALGDLMKPKVAPYDKSPFPNSCEEAGATTTQAPSSNQQAVLITSTDLHQVFVSYADEDRTLADQIVEVLEHSSCLCWVSHRNIHAGRSWASAITEAIACSRIVVVVVSKYSNVSQHVLREVTIADQEKIPLIPLCIDDTSLSSNLNYFFITTQRLEAATIPREQALQRLEEAVKQQLQVLGGI